MGLQWKEVVTDKGVLKYRMPDIAEGYEYLALADELKNGADILMTKAKMIRKMKSLLDFSALGYASYEELLSDKENMAVPIKDIVHEIFVDTTSMFSKKN